MVLNQATRLSAKTAQKEHGDSNRPMEESKPALKKADGDNYAEGHC